MTRSAFATDGAATIKFKPPPEVIQRELEAARHMVAAGTATTVTLRFMRQHAPGEYAAAGLHRHQDTGH